MLVFLDDGVEQQNEEIALDISDLVIQHLDEYYFAPEDKQDDCNVAGIKLHGILTTYIPNENMECSYGECYQLVDEVSSENIVFAIKEAEKDNNIKAIILEIDSYGGDPVAAEEIVNALKHAVKPTVAIIRSGGVSAAYWSATGADVIFASKNSDVGSIGITMSYLDNVKKNQKDGLTFNQLSTGEFKDTLHPDKPLTNKEKKLIRQDIINPTYKNFINDVAENRNIAIDKVEKLADGSFVLGEAALENGLIDRIGGFHEVDEYVKEIIGEEAEICWQ